MIEGARGELGRAAAAREPVPETGSTSGSGHLTQPQHDHRLDSSHRAVGRCGHRSRGRGDDCRVTATAAQHGIVAHPIHHHRRSRPAQDE